MIQEKLDSEWRKKALDSCLISYITINPTWSKDQNIRNKLWKQNYQENSVKGCRRIQERIYLLS